MRAFQKCIVNLHKVMTSYAVLWGTRWAGFGCGVLAMVLVFVVMWRGCVCLLLGERFRGCTERAGDGFLGILLGCVFRAWCSLGHLVWIVSDMHNRSSLVPFGTIISYSFIRHCMYFTSATTKGSRVLKWFAFSAKSFWVYCARQFYCVANAFHFSFSVATQYLTKQHKIAVSFSKTKSSRPMSNQYSNPISCMINITCQSALENKIFVAISQNTRMFEFHCLLEEIVNCLAKWLLYAQLSVHWVWVEVLWPIWPWPAAASLALPTLAETSLLICESAPRADLIRLTAGNVAIKLAIAKNLVSWVCRALATES